MFNECLEIGWKTAQYCILNFSFKNEFVWEEMSNIWHSVSSPDETLRLMFDILLEEAGLDIPLPANNTKGRRQLTELESVSHALSVNLRMTVVLLKITLFSYFILCFTWHKMRASKSNHWSSDLFMRHKVWLQKTSYYKKISKWILTLQTSFYSFS